MSKISKAEQFKVRCDLEAQWRDDAVNGVVTVLIVWHEGKNTSTERRDYYSVHTVAGTRLYTYTYNLWRAGCYRLGRQDSHRRDWLAIDGCGYSKPDAIVDMMRLIAPNLKFNLQVIQ